MMQLDFFLAEVEAEEEDNQEELICCPDCNELKPVSEYYVYEDKSNGKLRMNGSRRRCKPCYLENQTKVYYLKKKHPYPYHNPVCDCCGKLCDNETLNLDHDHKTGRFRGYLCKSCNTGIGLLGDTIEGLNMGIRYLKKSNE